MAGNKGNARHLKGVLAQGCKPWKTPLHQSPNIQHKAKIEPGKSFVKSEPHAQVKFLWEKRTNIQISVKFKGSPKSFSPGENTYPDWPSSPFRPPSDFSGKAMPIEPRSSIKTRLPLHFSRLPTQYALPRRLVYSTSKKNIKAIITPLTNTS